MENQKSEQQDAGNVQTVLPMQADSTASHGGRGGAVVGVGIAYSGS